MQEIIAKIEKIIFDFKKQNENKLELHLDVLNSFSEKERSKIKDFSTTLKPMCNELTTFTRIFDNDIKSMNIRYYDAVDKRIILEWSYPREHIPGLVLTDTCWNYVDLNEVLRLIKRL